MMYTYCIYSSFLCVCLCTPRLHVCLYQEDHIHAGKLMHHTVTAIAGGTAALVIGGRGSPAQPNESMFLLQLKGTHGNATWSKIELHPDSSLMEARWRHTATCTCIDGEITYTYRL